jgi:phage terminase Nu1 subunit (DNA packaging protein)
VSRSELAVVFGVTTETVDEWVRKECPYVRRGGPGRVWQFNTAHVHRWHLDDRLSSASRTRHAGRLDPTEQRARKDAALAEATELKNAEARGELIPRHVIHEFVTAAFGRVRTKLLALPSRLATQLSPAMSPQKVRDLLTRGVHDALRELASTGGFAATNGPGERRGAAPVSVRCTDVGIESRPGEEA